MSRLGSLRSLMAFAGVLALSLGLEIALHLGAHRWIPTEQVSLDAPHRAELNNPVQTKYTADLNNWATTILDRPLFRVDRKPVLAVEADSDGGDGALPHLSGVIGYGANRLAVFQPVSGGHLLLQKEGSRIGQWTVETVAPDRVTLRGPNGAHELHPHADHGRLPGEAVDNPSAESAQSSPLAHPTIPQPSVP